MLRHITDALKDDAQVLSSFCKLALPASFHVDDLRKVFLKYLYRVETMIGREIGSQLIEELKMNEVDTLGSLRKIKAELRREVKGEVTSKRKGEINSKDKEINIKDKVLPKTKSKRRRRKKKNW